MAETNDGGAVYSDVVQDLLASEEKRREALTARGMSVITISGALVTLLLGLAALVTGSSRVRLNTAGLALVAASVIAFAVSAMLALVTYAPLRERGPAVGELGMVLRETWDEGADFARKKVVATRLLLIKTTQDANDRRASALLAAVGAQAVAVILLAIAVALVV